MEYNFDISATINGHNAVQFGISATINGHNAVQFGISATINGIMSSIWHISNNKRA